MVKAKTKTRLRLQSPDFIHQIPDLIILKYYEARLYAIYLYGLIFLIFIEQHVSLIQNESYWQSPEKKRKIEGNMKREAILVTLRSLEFIHQCYILIWIGYK